MANHVKLRKREVVMLEEDGNNFYKIQSFPTCVFIQFISSEVYSAALHIRLITAQEHIHKFFAFLYRLPTEPLTKRSLLFFFLN